MSKYNVASALQKELRKINQEIDQKIISGRSYYREARRHKSLLSQLSRVRRGSFSLLSFF
jgi:hypothetical protein